LMSGVAGAKKSTSNKTTGASLDGGSR
jgi:hypothetical protein